MTGDVPPLLEEYQQGHGFLLNIQYSILRRNNQKPLLFIMKWRILTLRLGIYSPIPLLPPLKSLHNGCFSKNYNHQLFLRWLICQGAKKAMFTSCHWGKLKLTLLAQTSFSTSPKNILMFGLISQFFCNLNSSKKLHLLIGQVNNRIHWPDSKIR